MDQRVIIWDLETGKALHTIEQAHKRSIHCLDLAQHDGGNAFLTGSRDHLIKLWDTRTCQVRPPMLLRLSRAELYSESTSSERPTFCVLCILCVLSVFCVLLFSCAFALSFGLCCVLCVVCSIVLSLGQCLPL